MGKHKRLTSIEILLILAIIAVLAVWLFPRLLKTLDFNSSTIGTVKPYIGDAFGTGGLNKLLRKDISETRCCPSTFKVLGIDQTEPWNNLKSFGKSSPRFAEPLSLLHFIGSYHWEKNFTIFIFPPPLDI